MKKKWILRVLIGLFLIFVVVVVAVAFSLGDILKKGIERIGPNATQVDVKVKSAGVWIVASRVELTGLVIGNPPGYTMSNSISIGDVSVSVKPGSVFSDKLIVKTIHVKDPVITLEGGLKINNLTKIEKNLDDYIGSSSTAPQPPPQPASAPQSSEPKAERKLQVDDLLISGAKLQVKTKLVGNRVISLTIPTIHLTGLGEGPEGITPVEVAQRTLHEIEKAATEEIVKNGGELEKEGLNDAKSVVKKASDTLKGLFH